MARDRSKQYQKMLINERTKKAENQLIKEGKRALSASRSVITELKCKMPGCACGNEK